MSSYSVEAVLKATGADKFAQSFENASRSVKGLEQAAGKMKSIGSQISGVGSQLTNNITKPATIAMTAVGGLVATLGFKRLVGVDTAKAKLKGLGYEGKDVDRIMEQVVNATKTGMTTVGEGADIAAGALAAGVKEGADLERYIKLVGDAAVGANRPVDEMAQIFNRVQGGGRLMTMELNQIEHGLPGFSQAMAKHLGVPVEKMREMVTAGEVSSKDFLNVMEDFGGGMADAMAESMAGMAKNVLAYVGIIGEALIGGLFEDGKKGMAEFIEVLKSEEVLAWAEQTGEKIREVVTNIVDKVRDMKAAWDELSEPMQNIIQKVVLFGAIGLVAIGPVLQIVGFVITAFGVLSGAVAALTLPMTMIIGIVGLISAAVIYLLATNEDFRANVVRIWNAVKDTIMTVLDALSPAFTIFGATLGVLVMILSDVILWVSGVIATFAEWVQEMIETHSWIIQVINVIGIIIGVVLSAIAVLTVIAAVVAVVAKAFAILTAIVAFFTSPIGLVILAIGAVIAVFYLLWQGLQMLGEKFEWIGNIMDTVSSFMSEKWNAFLGFFGKGTKEASDEASESISSTAEKGKTDLDGLATEGTASSQELNANFLGNMQGMEEGTMLSLGSMKDGGISSLDMLKEQGSAASSVMSDNVTGDIAGMTSESGDLLKQLESSGNIDMKGLNTGVTSEVGGMSADSMSLISDLQAGGSADFSALQSDATGSASKTSSDVSSSFSKMSNNVDKDLSNLGKSANTSMTGVAESFASSMTLVNQTMQTSMKMINQTVTTSMRSVGLSVKTSFRMIVSDTRSSTRMMNTTVAQSLTLMLQGYRASFSAIQNAIRSGMNSAVSAVRNGNLFIVANVRSLNGQLYSAGIHAMSGLRSGLNAGSGSVISTARGIANRVSSTIKSALKVKSPSRVMMEIGNNVGEGLAIGMEKTARLVDGASDALGSSAIPELADINVGGRVNDINKRAERSLTHTFNSNLNVEKQPAIINVHVGSKQVASEIVNDITELQNAATYSRNKARRR